MKTWRELPGAVAAPRSTPAAVTIGTFDGVHRGHQAVLARTRQAGGDLPVVAVTFDPHPTAVFAPDHVPLRLTSLQRRIALLHQHGADEVRVLAFDREMAAMSPEEFVQVVLVEQLQAAHVLVGENFRFGARAAGDVDLLVARGAVDGFTAEGLGLQGEDDRVWSSTRVRELVAGGDLRGAADVLGRPHEVVGEVVRGQQRGRELGYRTANTPVDATYAVPPDGVYAGRVVRDGADGEAERLPAAISIGTNPTFGEHDRRVESHVLDRTDLDLYGETIRVELVEQLRPMVSFDGVEALLEQMARDVEDTRTALDS